MLPKENQPPSSVSAFFLLSQGSFCPLCLKTIGWLPPSRLVCRKAIAKKLISIMIMRCTGRQSSPRGSCQKLPLHNLPFSANNTPVQFMHKREIFEYESYWHRPPHRLMCYIRTRPESRINTGFSLILSNFQLRESAG